MQRPPMRIEVVAYAPVTFFHCMHCELVWQASAAPAPAPPAVGRREQLESSLPDDLAQLYQQLSDWVRRMVALYGERLRFRIIDAASIEGWIMSLKYGLRRYPAVIIDGREKSIGPEFERATALIERRLG